MQGQEHAKLYLQSLLGGLIECPAEVSNDERAARRGQSRHLLQQPGANVHFQVVEQALCNPEGGKACACMRSRALRAMERHAVSFRRASSSDQHPCLGAQSSSSDQGQGDAPVWGSPSSKPLSCSADAQSCVRSAATDVQDPHFRGNEQLPACARDVCAPPALRQCPLAALMSG